MYLIRLIKATRNQKIQGEGIDLSRRKQTFPQYIVSQTITKLSKVMQSEYSRQARRRDFIKKKYNFDFWPYL